ncbi:class I SAM-dependent methyltransferase [Desulfoscipio gibsoniae]|uniref:Methylase involved in ubiquinone/menaquinone biosynthesis n=1 Tax=Desulfoscipio gibsoniae DSM 7213 TaxID=767817 RepID=R4KCR6_9FIRM|nr:methyltransferase domain-containing protein [Desulfoscipio gibsoniae]AGL00374.1 methylase involved in ubiquinone/menaquinone biosynthesis [Desulfoscipio gibsoniae DSM 7213]
MDTHREWFNKKAETWDNVVLEAERCHRLFDLITVLDIQRDSRVLDVASGTGILIPWLLEIVGTGGKVVAVDFAEKMIDVARGKYGDTGVDLLVADVQQLPFEDNSFDEVICNSAFPHFAGKLDAMREMSRVLKSGGRLTICHPAPREELNNFHRCLGGVVGNDMLPSESEMRQMAVKAGLDSVFIKDGPATYLFTCRKVR